MMITVKNLNFKYGEKSILENINFNIQKNKFYSILGPNGSGKTTLLKNINKSLEQIKNTIFIENEDLYFIKNKDLAKKISWVPQNTSIDFDFSVMDIVLMGRNPYISRFSSESHEDLTIVEESMKITNTWNLKDKNIRELSGGERQRVIIARALAQKTDILLLDEPTSNLDIHHQIELLDTIKFVNSNMTIVAVLHDLNLASQYSDYLILLKDGKIISIGTPEQVLTKHNIQLAYDIDVNIIKDPITLRPHIIPISKKLIENQNNLYKNNITYL